MQHAASEKILLILSLFCLAYYLSVGLFAGFGISALWIWLLAAAFFGVWSLWLSLVRRGVIKPLPPKLAFALKLIFAVGLLMALVLIGAVLCGMFRELPPDLDYVLILGAAVHGETPSVALQTRLNAAYDYYLGSPQTCLICSGGQGNGERISEAEAMRRFLLARDIPAESLLIEDASTSTVENMRYSLPLIEEPDAEIGIITSNFHVTRALLLADDADRNMRGERRFYALACSYPNILILHYIVREAIALVAEYLRGTILNSPLHMHIAAV